MRLYISYYVVVDTLKFFNYFLCKMYVCDNILK